MRVRLDWQQREKQREELQKGPTARNKQHCELALLHCPKVRPIQSRTDVQRQMPPEILITRQEMAITVNDTATETILNGQARRLRLCFEPCEGFGVLIYTKAKIVDKSKWVGSVQTNPNVRRRTLPTDLDELFHERGAVYH